MGARSITLRYGARVIEAERPAGIEWRDPVPIQAPPALGSPVSATVRGALVEPIGADPLDAFVAGASRVVVVCPDRTRPLGLDAILPRVLSTIGGVEPLPRITVVTGGGTHAPDPIERLESMVPADWRGRVDLDRHDPTAPGALVDLGVTSRGTPVRVHRSVCEADAVVVLGAIGFHYFAGYTGGRKGLVPGLAASETVRANHRLVLAQEPAIAFEPACQPGRLDGNPVHEDLLEAAKRVPAPVFLVNALAGSGERSMGTEGYVAGDLDAAHRAGAARYGSRHRARLHSPVDLVVADAGGHPRDIDLVQAHKALFHAAAAVRPGGTIVLAARCAEGAGSPTLLRWFEPATFEESWREARRAYTLNAHTALSLRRIAEWHRLLLVTDLPPGVCEQIGAERAADLPAALVCAERDRPRTGAVLSTPQATVFEMSVADRRS